MTAHDYSPAFSRNDQSAIAKWFWTVDRGLLAAALTLIGLGVALSFASSPAAILADESISDPFHYSWRMIVWATGGTAAAAVALMKKLGATVLEFTFFVELAFLHGRDKLPGVPIRSLVQF